MGAPECRKITAEVTRVLSTESDLRLRMLQLATRPVDGAEVCELLASYLDEGTAADLRDEFRELPSIMGAQIVMAFSLAEAGGKTFAFESVAPEGPLTFARRRQVRFMLDVTAECVTLGVAHVAGRKAQWYQPHRQTEVLV